MADFDLGGLLGNMFGGGDSELEKLLTAKQKEQLGLQSSLAAAAALLLILDRGNRPLCRPVDRRRKIIPE